MKVYKADEKSYKVFVNSFVLEKFDFSVEKDLEKFLKNILLSMKNKYKINLNGLYIVDLFINNEIGAFICINKTDAFFHYKDIDLKIKIIFNCKFYFKTSIYEVLKDLENVYFYQNNYYVDANNLSNIMKYIEFGDIIYDEEFDVENSGIKITKSNC